MYFLKIKTPTISVIIGEGGSGGAIGIATSDRVLMLEHSTYSVISPETELQYYGEVQIFSRRKYFKTNCR